MKSMISATATLALLGASIAALTLPTVPAQASSPSQTQCEADGGVFIRDGGQVYCIKSEHVGNSDNSQTVNDSEGSNGTLNNNPKHQASCDGTGNTTSPQDHCH